MERLNIPRPPESLIDSFGGHFQPSPAIDAFVRSAILNEDSELFNIDHVHLLAASIGYLWTDTPNTRRMRRIVGEAEIPNFKAGKWQKARQERQLIDWFGSVPDFVITFDAGYCIECDDVGFLALLEHELYHCGQAVDAFGMPRFSRDTGKPIFGLRGHDVEEFIGVVRRYGVAASGQNAVDMVLASLEAPEVGAAKVAEFCGTCRSV